VGLRREEEPAELHDGDDDEAHQWHHKRPEPIFPILQDERQNRQDDARSRHEDEHSPQGELVPCRSIVFNPGRLTEKIFHGDATPC
jgi:hypothetical protein